MASIELPSPTASEVAVKFITTEFKTPYHSFETLRNSLISARQKKEEFDELTAIYFIAHFYFIIGYIGLAKKLCQEGIILSDKIDCPHIKADLTLLEQNMKYLSAINGTILMNRIYSVFEGEALSPDQLYKIIMNIIRPDFVFGT